MLFLNYSTLRGAAALIPAATAGGGSVTVTLQAGKVRLRKPLGRRRQAAEPSTAPGLADSASPCCALLNNTAPVLLC